jgi:hypothetical protein
MAGEIAVGRKAGKSGKHLRARGSNKPALDGVSQLGKRGQEVGQAFLQRQRANKEYTQGGSSGPWLGLNGGPEGVVSPERHNAETF